MSHYSLDELITRWKKEDLTEAQMIGQLLQLLRRIEERLRELEQAHRHEQVSSLAVAAKRLP